MHALGAFCRGGEGEDVAEVTYLRLKLLFFFKGQIWVLNQK